MATHSITYTAARKSFSALMDEVEDHRNVVVVTRRGHEDVALISADELSSLETTAHLLRSPANASRLAEAMRDADEGRVVKTTIDELMKRPSGAHQVHSF